MIGENKYRLCIIWSSAITSVLYKKVINKYGKKYFDYHISTIEDCIINFFIHKLAKSSENFLKIGYLHISRALSCSHSEYFINKMKSEIYYLGTFFVFNASLKDKFLALRDLSKIIESKYFQVIIKDFKINIFLKKIIRKIILDSSIPSSKKSFLKIN